MSNPLKKLAGQTAVYGLSSIVGRLLNYLLVPLYVSVFVNTSDYGVVSELYAWIAFLMVLLTFGMETAFFKFLSDHPNKKESIFRNSMLSVSVINLAFLVLILLFNGWIADKMLFPYNPEYIILLALIVVVDATSALPLAKLRAEDKAKKFAIIQLSGIGVNIGLNLILMLFVFQPETQNPEVGIRFILIANLVASLIKPAFLYRDFLNLKWIWDTTLVKSMFKYSFPLALAGFAFIINETVDRILLKHLTYQSNIGEFTTETALKIAESQVGIYSASYKLAMLVTIFLQAYRYAAEPFFFVQAKNKDRNKTYVKVMNYFVGAVFLSFLGVALNLDIFKYFIPNPDYWEGLKIVPILLLANVFSGIYINQSIWYKLSGQTKFGAYIALGGAAITLTLNFIFIPIYGYMACAWATFIVYGSQMVASYMLGQKHYPIPYNLRKFGLYSITAILIYFLLSWIDIEAGILQIIVHNFFILLYVALVYWMEKPRTVAKTN
ncbi:oligosaccharide flippase family protein [Brumimicrobium aurantiacum]|uniref:Polysaccharide biosynthesis protein n=1 Tax=Brumimicrobium aurantiacum TaxID=1737063 RepID=A0A3E1EX88_9FLAO|nr:oligosaccharide flippase family protein [Brumimicrobium aurantiacum]RFC54181.1 polysaccharide biosynthesis protein [Brumimicrobium aurantiacum]